MTYRLMTYSTSLFVAMALATCTAVVTPVAVAAEQVAPSPTAKAAESPAPSQKAFETPEALFQALADAAKAGDSKALVALLGPGGEELVNSGDAVADKRRMKDFASDYAEKHSVTMDGDAKATLVVGDDDWPMPIPAVKNSEGWQLDSDEGAHEILARRIGENELDAIQVVEAVVDAQRDYASEDRNVDGLRDYAARFISSEGKKDGLYWPTKDGEPLSPLGPLVGRAAAEGYKGHHGKPTPYHGYYFRLLTAQGKDAPGGARNYLVQGKLLGGFAVVAYPAAYGNSGIMTFIANQDGVVHQKDLGEDTATIAQGMKAYDPDQSWAAVK